MLDLLYDFIWVIRWKLIRFWLKLYAADYCHVIKREGLPATLDLIDEDEELLGASFNHTMVRAGCIAYAEDRRLVARPYNAMSANRPAGTPVGR